MDSTNDGTELVDNAGLTELSARTNTLGSGTALGSSTEEFARLRATSRDSMSPSNAGSRAPELLGADELAAAPHPFPPPRIEATPLIASLIAPLEPAPRTVAGSPVSPVLSAPLPASLPATLSPSVPVPLPTPPSLTPTAGATRPAALDFEALIHAPLASTPSPDSSAPLLAEPRDDFPDEPDISRSTIGEKLALILSIIVPPVGVIASIVAAAVSARRRGWVIGLVKAGLAIGIVLSVVVVVGGGVGFTLLRQQQHHDELAAASARFCKTISADPSMIAAPDFGWPPVEASIPDSLAAMTAFRDKWVKLAEESPAGIKSDVLAVADAANQIVASVSSARTIDDSSNVTVMTSVASASGVPAWYSEYCH